MNRGASQLYFLLAIIGGILILSFFIFKPFIYTLALAVIFATICEPIERRITKHLNGREGWGAFLTVLLVIIFIIVPLMFLGFQIFQEAQTLYTSFTEIAEGEVAQNKFNELLNRIPYVGELSIDVNPYLKQGLSFTIGHLDSVFKSIATILLNSFIFFIAFYYFLKDGKKLKKKIVHLSPLSDTDDESIFDKLGNAIGSVVRGQLLVALIQGILACAGFMIFGIPSPILWGSLTAIAALIPGVGTALVITPAIIFLFITGETPEALGLLAWGTVAVGLIDNILGPKLLGHNIRIHPLLILLSVLGGIGFFGPTGFLLGPLVLSLLFTLTEMYSSVLRKHRN
jgi:predicted PurR-regulated permease PerM